MSDTIRIVVIDDHPLFRNGVAKTLSGEPGLEVVGEGSSAEEALRLAAEMLPDIVLLDVSLPGGGIAAARRIADECPVVRIIMLTVSENDDDVIAAFQAGARGYILKGVGGDDLVAIIHAVNRGESYVSPDLAARLLSEMRTLPAARTHNRTPLSDLTAREEQILKLVARGFSNKEIGRELGLQEKTIKHYMTNILQKLQVRNRVEAAIMARGHFAAA